MRTLYVLKSFIVGSPAHYKLAEVFANYVYEIKSPDTEVDGTMKCGLDGMSPQELPAWEQNKGGLSRSGLAQG